MSEDPTVARDGWRPLRGGTMASVARRGDVVRRSTGPWTPAVHALLRHLEAVGFDRAPRVLGTDPAGRELLTYLPGEVPSPRTWVGDDRAVADAGRVLRRYHDAVATFPAGTVRGWDTFFQEDGGVPEVICHNDFGVYNCVFVAGRPWGMIDFDGAAPGSRLWDVAASACGFVPLAPPVPLADRARRLRLFCDGYGLADRTGLVATMLRRLTHVRDRLLAAGPDVPQAANATVDIAYWDRSLRLIAAQRSRLEAALR